MKIRHGWIAVLLAFAMLHPAFAESVNLPAQTRRIAAESFDGCESLTEVVIPEGAQSIGDRAFSGCSGLLEVTIPDSVLTFGEDCFAGCSEAMLINCAGGSAALEYAKEHGFDYQADTVCRALVVGQSYAGTNIELVGPLNDAAAVEACLKNQPKRPFGVDLQINLTASELLERAEDCFSSATDRDISLFYYSGHGEKQGELIGSDKQFVTPEALRAVLDKVPGRKIVIIDACYSGNWVTDAAVCAAADEEETDFAQAFLQGFLGRARSTGEYYVIAAASADEESWEKPITSGSKRKSMGCFTYSFCVGCGWDGVAELAVDRAADENSDGAVSVAEAFRYARAQTQKLYMGQHAQTNAEGCTGFAPFR